MRADPRANVAACLRIAAAMAAVAQAVTSAGCAMESPGILMPRPAAMKAQPAPVARMSSKAIDEGVALIGERRYAEAEMKFRRVQVWFQAEGDKARTAECLFWIGFCREKQGRTAEAREQYDKLIRDYPGTGAARQASERMGRLPAEPAPTPPKGN